MKHRQICKNHSVYAELEDAPQHTSHAIFAIELRAVKFNLQLSTTTVTVLFTECEQGATLVLVGQVAIGKQE